MRTPSGHAARTVAVTGATGLIGRHLIDALLARGDRPVALARRATGLPAGVEVRPWSAATPAAPLDGCDAVVHLAGAPVGRRWTPAARRAIEESRIAGTASVVEGLRRAGVRTLVSGSGIDASGDTGEAEVDESAPFGAGFLADVCRRWEAAAEAAGAAGARVVVVRTGMVLAAGAGALARLEPIFRLGAGGPQGSGRQWVAWIHLADEVGLILHALDRPDVEGPLVAAAPNPVRNRDFARALGHALHRPALFPTPALALRLAVGEMASVILASHRALPLKALATGFRFRFPELPAALADLYRR
jgi:uncharacterized protein (TIGR01777 family)